METMLLAHSQRAGLRKEHSTPERARWERWMSLSPVPVFIVSGALAFVWPWLTLFVWATTPFVQVVLTRLFPGSVARTADRRWSGRRPP